MDKSGYSRFEHGPVGADPRGAHGREGYAMVAPLQGNDFGLFRFSLDFPVIAGCLEVAVTRFTTSGCEEEVVDRWIGDRRQTFGEIDGFWIRAARVSRAISEAFHLLGRGVGELFSTVSGRNVPQSGKSVDILLAAGVY